MAARASSAVQSTSKRNTQGGTRAAVAGVAQLPRHPPFQYNSLHSAESPELSALLLSYFSVMLVVLASCLSLQDVLLCLQGGGLSMLQLSLGGLQLCLGVPH